MRSHSQSRCGRLRILVPGLALIHLSLGTLLACSRPGCKSGAGRHNRSGPRSGNRTDQIPVLTSILEVVDLNWCNQTSSATENWDNAIT